MKENKKVVKTVSKIVSDSKRIIQDMKKRWDTSEPRRKILEADAKKLMKKIEKKGRSTFDASVQLKKDITKGIKHGLK